MNIIPSFYRVTKIYEVVDEIIESYKISSYSSVSLSDKLQVCGAIISHQSENNCTDWLDALSDKEFAKVTSDYLTSQIPGNRIELLCIFKESIVSHYEELMEQIFNKRIDQYEEFQKEPRNEDF